MPAETPATTSAKQNSRVELLAEALENLAVGISANVLSKQSASRPPPAVTEFLQRARGDLRDRLREFLVPSFRVLHNARQPYGPEVPEHDRVLCGKCLRHYICADLNCPHWHAAVRSKVQQPYDEPPDDAA